MRTPDADMQAAASALRWRLWRGTLARAVSMAGLAVVPTWIKAPFGPTH
jgi:hypothetical protein